MIDNSSSPACSNSRRLYCINLQSSSAAPSDPASFSASGVGKTQVAFSFSSGGGTTASYALSYTPGATAPANCTSGTQVSAYTIGPVTSYIVTGLGANTLYSFRLCATNSDLSAYSTGLTVTLTTASTDFYAFVTSSTVAGSFGASAGTPLADADTICQSAATSGGLSGAWKAIISVIGADASSLISISQPVFDTSASHNLIASNAAEFWSGSLTGSIRYDENGVDRNGSTVWTGTNSDGTYVHSDTCSDWSSNSVLVYAATGTAGATNTMLFYNQDINCSASLRLYCINQ